MPAEDAPLPRSTTEFGRERGVLSGLRVIELSAFVAAPLGGMTLAQMGADVIRVDPIGGGLDHRRWPLTEDGLSLYWAGLNKGKRSVALDLATDEGRDLVRRLIVSSGPDGGIVVTNLAPRWLSYEELRKSRPDLILVVLTGAPDGAIAVDYTVNAATGYPIVTGPEGRVVNHVLPGWDVVAGVLVATSVLAAERWRSRTGEGTMVELSLADVAFSTVAHLGHVAEVIINDTDRASYGNFVYGTFGRDFDTADSNRVMVTAFTRRQWEALVDATASHGAIRELEARRHVDLRDEGDRFAARDEIAKLLAPWFLARPIADIGVILDEHRVCWGPYQTFRQLVEDDPRVDPAVNPMWHHVEQPGIGRYPTPASPLAFSAVQRPAPRPAPSLGADTEHVLTEIAGLSTEELESLRRTGVI
jgi:2-methylfumaryl-CoA isomerase